ncbi:MAG: family 43 glycosylhydrolase [Lachnospiraceae bacterium]|nr:family 43 glycosylhydrolase [Lachnospiraceae bacterium]
MSKCYHFNMDIPDPDVIFYEGYYYLITTTMHFFPGGEILRSKDLKKWEYFSYVFERLESTPAQRLEGDGYIYGKGMWAPTLRFHDGVFYVAFSSNDMQKTYLYRSSDLKGPWSRNEIKGFYHDLSLLFDDGKAYLVYGNTDIHLTELNDGLTAPKEGGLDRVIVSDAGNPMLGLEGSHIYKIARKYYLFMIHSLRERWRRVEAMYVSDSLEGEFVGGDIYDNDLGILDSGIAQGGIVSGPLGDHLIMFQDSGAVGRLPVVVPFRWVEGKPVFEEEGVEECEFVGLSGDDDFKDGYKAFWQFNHEPDFSLISFDEGLRITTDKNCKNIFHAKNTLTQKIEGPVRQSMVTIDAADLSVGDYAGLSAFQGDYAFVGVTKKEDGLYAVMLSNESKGGIWDLSEEKGLEEESFKISGTRLSVSVKCDFTTDTATCFIESSDGLKQIGTPHKLRFRLDHFTGCRFALSCFSTESFGGSAVFKNFRLK